MSKSSHHSQPNNLIRKVRGRRWLALGGLLILMLLLGGCTVMPVTAGEPPVMPVPLGDEQVLAIAPSTAASGTTIAVAGAGWQPNEVVYVNLEGLMDGVDVESTMVMTNTNGEGRFVTEFVAPLDIFWQGATDVQVAAYSLDKARSAAVPFTFGGATATAPPPMTPAFTPTAVPPTVMQPTLAPTRVPTLAPTVRPVTPVPQPDGTARVTSAGLNMRSGPGVNYPILRTLTNGAWLVVLGQNYSGQWLYVQSSDLTLGWVARNYTSFRGSAPIINTPPTPIPPATWTPAPFPTPLPTYVPPPSGAWLGEYYANRFLSGFPTVVRQDERIDFNWGTGSPAPGIPVDNFSVRWSSTPYFDAGNYRFQARADDGVRVWVDGNLIIDQWHNWRPETYVADIWLGAGNHQVVVDYFEEAGLAYISMWWERRDPDHFSEWRGEYFSNRHLDGNPAYVRNDRDIDFNWGTGSPAPGVPSTNFSVRWTRRIDFSSGTYHLHARADDGIRVWVDGHRVIDAWYDSDFGPTHSAEIYLSGHHDVRVEYYQHLGGARVHFWWDRIHRGTATPTRTPTQTPSQTPTVTNTPTVTPTPTNTATATPVASNPYADVNPQSGPVGTNVTISFGNFPPNTTVNLYLGAYVNAAAADAANARIYATTSSDRFGRGSLAFAIPAAWPDGAPIEPSTLALLLATPNFGVTAAADFNVLRPQPTVAPNPYAEANPSSGGAGTVVTVRGGGFPANTTLNFYLGGVVRASGVDAAAPIATALSDANGNFTTSLTVPTAWPDGQPITTGKLVILVATPNFSVEASANFDFFTVAPNPAVTLNPTAGNAGALVTVTGSGYPANVNVGVFLAPLDTSVGVGEPERYATGRTDSNGRISLSFAMPSAWPNGAPIAQDQIVVTLARMDFSVSASAVFTYLTPGPTWTPTATATATTTPQATATPVPAPEVSISPRSGTAGTVVTITGSDFPSNSTVYAHLAVLGASGGSGNEYANYAVVTTDGSGAFNLTITMPSVWPNGTPVPTERLVIQMATADYSSQASASFDYRSVAGAAEEPTAVPTEAPTEVATEVATEAVTAEPTIAPTAEPTEAVIEEPTVVVPPDAPAQSVTRAATPTAELPPKQAATNTPAPTREATATPQPTEEDTPTPAPTREPTATPGVTPTDEPPARQPTPTAAPAATSTPRPPTVTPVPATAVPPTEEPRATEAVIEDPVEPTVAPPIDPTWTPTVTLTTTLTITPLQILELPVPIDPDAPEDPVQ